MAKSDTDQAAPESAPQIELEGGTYEIIQNRLSGFGKELSQRLEKLNAERKQVFGSIDTRLLGTERITTDHNCVPRDMVAVGNRFLFGYNVHFGLKTETHLDDVFSIYEFTDGVFHPQPLDAIGDEQFRKDFQDVYRYYKNALFAKFFVDGPHLYMVFRIGKNASDIKTFKWLVKDDQLIYVDARSDHEVDYPPQHEFEWKRTHRNLHQQGVHPHISIEDRVFVETIGGDLTVKIENNTDTGEGIYSEPVDNVDQTLDDAEVFYAAVGNIVLLKIRPFQERNFRHIVYNDKIQRARRLDAVQHACVLLPDDHGLIFSNGYYLQTGEHKTFETASEDMLFERRVASPNGEDFLYVFYNRLSGVYVLLQYNLIEQKVETPIVCHGFTLFEGGELVCFKSQDEAQKHHTVQVWQTPYVGEGHIQSADSDSYLFKIGNRDVVRGMAECHEVLNLLNKEDTYSNLYVDIVKATSDIIDSYFWIDHAETFDLKGPLEEIKGAAASAIDEFDKVVRVKRNTAQQTTTTEKQTREVLAGVAHRRYEVIGDFVESLSSMRTARGEIISLRELRYVDTELVDALEKEVAETSERLAGRCVEFLLRENSLLPFEQAVETQRAGIDSLTTVADAREVEEAISTSAGELEMLIEIVGNLNIDDATKRTTIIDNISAIFSTVNQARAVLKKKTHELLSVEGVAEFSSQMKLLNQSVVNYLDICDSPEKCEEFLTKVMIQIEELEGKFAEFDEFVIQLTEKREEIYSAFENRKVALLEARNKRAAALGAAADRILAGIKSRVDSLESVNEINGYFASDLMIDKVRDIVAKLDELDDSVKVDDIQSRLKTVREDAVRQLKDRQELFVDGKNVIQFGKHRFSVNVQALDVTTVLRDSEIYLHLTGTNFFEKTDDEILKTSDDVRDQDVVSENRDVYRGEYLAFKMLSELGQAGPEAGLPTLDEVHKSSQDELVAGVARFMGPRYSEGYVKGVHDHDAALLLKALAEMESSIGMLRYRASARALASFCWQHLGEKRVQTLLTAKLKGVGQIGRAFPQTVDQAKYVAELQELISDSVAQHGAFDDSLIPEAAEYLFDELSQGAGFVVSRAAANLRDDFKQHLQRGGFAQEFEASVKAVHRDPAGCLTLLRDWVQAFQSGRDNPDEAEYVDEAANLLLMGKADAKHVVDADVTQNIAGMTGTHATIDGTTYHLHYNRFMSKLRLFEQSIVPRFIEYGQAKKSVVEKARDDMRLDEFRPRVLTSFVRNRLLDTVYLPLIGDNLAKQIGVTGEQKRTDRMGLLLLISPPGYGKTTLMEYVANRLGIIFMKINGPAIGHAVTSLDPAETTNAAAREEVEKLNLALEMGDNVMIYLDDIQHCNPELLQKFISLCDAQRKIEGVYKGQSRTYDLRGRKVAVVMAGNPYTESGEKFQIPDMLSNRADIYNLGEIIGDSADAFELSYLENSLTSNPVLNQLALRSQKDVHAIVEMASSGRREGIDLEGSYSLEELNEFVATMQKMMRVRDIILTVNREYIRSAAQSDDYRTEPPFKLQGSYRNMNRIAEKVLPIMNDAELETLIQSNYDNDAQTLTSDTEANLLKFKELAGTLTDEESQRWEAIKKTFVKNVKMRGIGDDDKVSQVILQLSAFGDGLDAIRDAMDDGISKLASEPETADAIGPHAQQLIEQVSGLREGLDTITEALATGMKDFADIADQQTSLPAQSAFTPETLKQLATELRALSVPAEPTEPSKADSEDQQSTITVVNKIPPTLLNVLRHQFRLMERWMKPIFEATQSQGGDIRELKEQLEECLGDYAKLLERVGSARKQDEPE